jgi:hypothetical protein
VTQGPDARKPVWIIGAPRDQGIEGPDRSEAAAQLVGSRGVHVPRGRSGPASR